MHLITLYKSLEKNELYRRTCVDMHGCEMLSALNRTVKEKSKRMFGTLETYR